MKPSPPNNITKFIFYIVNMYTRYLNVSIFFPHLFTLTAGGSSYFFQMLKFNVEEYITCWIMKSGDSDIKWKMVSHM